MSRHSLRVCFVEQWTTTTIRQSQKFLTQCTSTAFQRSVKKTTSSRSLEFHFTKALKLYQTPPPTDSTKNVLWHHSLAISTLSGEKKLLSYVACVKCSSVLWHLSLMTTCRCMLKVVVTIYNSGKLLQAHCCCKAAKSTVMGHHYLTSYPRRLVLALNNTTQLR